MLVDSVTNGILVCCAVPKMSLMGHTLKNRVQLRCGVNTSQAGEIVRSMREKDKSLFVDRTCL